MTGKQMSKLVLVFVLLLAQTSFASSVLEKGERFLFKPRPSLQVKNLLVSKGLGFLLSQSALGRKVRVFTDGKMVLVLRGELHGSESAKNELSEAMQGMAFSSRNLLMQESLVNGSREEKRLNMAKGDQVRYRIKGLEAFEGVLFAFVHRAREFLKRILDSVEREQSKLGRVTEPNEEVLFLQIISRAKMRENYLTGMKWFREGIGIFVANPRKVDEYSQSLNSNKRVLLGKLGSFLGSMERDYQTGKNSLSELLDISLLVKEFNRICLVNFRAVKEVDTLLRDLQEEILLKAPNRYRSSMVEMIDDPGVIGYRPIVEWRNEQWIEHVNREIKNEKYDVIFAQVGRMHVDDFVERLKEVVPEFTRLL